MYAVLNMRYTPAQWYDLTEKEKAFIMAAIKLKVDVEKTNANKLKNSRRRK